MKHENYGSPPGMTFETEARELLARYLARKYPGKEIHRIRLTDFAVFEFSFTDPPHHTRVVSVAYLLYLEKKENAGTE
jgi:hypothetical protein